VRPIGPGSDPARSLRLIGERVVLRPPSHADFDAFTEMFTDPEVMRYVAWGRPLTAAEVRDFVERMIARFKADGFGQFAIERATDGEVIGRAGLLPLDPSTWKSGFFKDLGGDAEIELGWTLRRKYWGHGYATEAALLARDWAWSSLCLPRLVSIIQHGNDRSVRLAEKLGGRRERDLMTSFGKQASLFGYASPSAAVVEPRPPPT
jgi:RimJ/RimL family protein N-acetyltransferase